MLKASSLIETIFATVIISISLLIGISVYSKIISSAIGVRDVKIKEAMNSIYNSARQHRETLNEVYEYQGFKVFSETIEDQSMHLYELRLLAVYAEDTLVKKYMIYENK